MNRAVLRYRSPVSQMIVTITFPAFSGRVARLSAAHALAPAEMPVRTPSSFASLHVFHFDLIAFFQVFFNSVPFNFSYLHFQFACFSIRVWAGRG